MTRPEKSCLEMEGGQREAALFDGASLEDPDRETTFAAILQKLAQVLARAASATEKSSNLSISSEYFSSIR